MKQLLLYVTLIGGTICAMEEYNTIKSLLNNAAELKTYLETQDAYHHTPLMRLFDKATDQMLEEIVPLLKDCPFNTELAEASGETAFFYACDRTTPIAARLMLHLGAQIDSQSIDGRPIYLAFLNDNPPLLTLLIEEGANPKIPADILNSVARKPGYPELLKAISATRIP